VKYKALIYAILGLALLALPQGAFAGFGVSPGIIEEDRLVPGTVLERTIYLVQGNQTQDIAIEASVESKDIKDWITFKSGNTFTIPANQQQFPLDVVITVPEDAELGAYEAFIRVSTIPLKEAGSQITIALGGKVSVRLNVGDDVVSDFDVKSLDILDVKEGEKPKVSVVVTNTGNVPVAPENASFELFNKYGEIRLAYGESDLFTKVPAFSEGESVLEFPLDVKLGVGEYWGHVRIYDDGKVVKELRTVFNVTPLGLVEKYAVSIGIAALLVAALAVLAFIRRRR
jgi:uncharacterized protein YaiE (UPF0345 family)